MAVMISNLRYWQAALTGERARVTWRRKSRLDESGCGKYRLGWQSTWSIRRADNSQQRSAGCPTVCSISCTHYDACQL